MMNHIWLAAGSVAGLLGVALGAFGAHALRGRMAEDLAAIYRTAVEYQFYHAAALLVVGVLARNASSAWLQASGFAFSAGIILFSGSLYILALSGVRAWGAVTPIGGLALLGGWLCLLMFALRS